MATLTETAYYSRKIIRWGIIGLILFLILRTIFSIIFTAIRKAYPPAPLKPNYALGKLPKINFPKTASPSAQLTFAIQTISGDVPTASDAARVYFMPKNRRNLLSLTKAQSLVSKIGFTSTPRQLSDSVYQWIDMKNPLRIMQMNIVDNQFEYTYEYAHDLTLFENKYLPPIPQIIDQINEFFQNLELPLSDIDLNNPKISYMRLSGDKLEVTKSMSQADAIRLDFWRYPLEQIPVYTNTPDEGILSVIVSGSKIEEKNFLSIKYNYWPVNVDANGIYKLKTSKEAWGELQNGQGYFVQLPANNKILLTGMSLGYYDSQEAQLFLQPIYVFTGEDGFIGYVPAVAPPWTD